jgi:hypothetical protein
MRIDLRLEVFLDCDDGYQGSVRMVELTAGAVVICSSSLFHHDVGCG